MKIKSCPVSIKAAGTNEGTEDGVFEAIVAAYNLDSAGDKIMPGAFKDTLTNWEQRGNPIPVLWSHMSHDPDYHIGVVEEAEERDDGLWVKARLDMDAPKASQVYRLLKGRRVTQFSFAYDIEDGAYVEENGADPHFELRRLKLYEVGPTLIGANQATELLAVKSALRSHSTSTSDGEWDGPANEAHLSNDADGSTYKQAYAWADPDGDADTKAAYRFLHHLVDANSNVGAANVRAAITGIGVLNGGRGGATIPDADREGVYRHLAKHLRDADQEPPELKSRSDLDTERVKHAVQDAMAEKAGRTLSSKNEQRVRDIARIARELLDAVESSSNDGDDEKQAMPPVSATTEEPSGAKVDEPARQGTASIRQRIDLALLEAEVHSLTTTQGEVSP